MAGSTKGVIAFSVIGGVVAAALIGGYLLVWEPKQKKSRAQSEVTEFSDAWLKARECFIGKTPMSSDLYEAMMIRELTRSDVASGLAACEDLLNSARRPGKFAAENEAIEEAWHVVKAARSRLASALAHRIAKRPVRPPRELRGLLAEALAAAESAHVELLEAADLPLRPAAEDPLPAAAISPLHPDLGTTPTLADLYVDNNRVLAISEKDGARTLYLLSTKDPRVTPLRRGVFVGAGAAGWGVEKTGDTLYLRDLGPGTAPSSEREITALSETARVFGAIGDAAGGRLVLLWDAEARGGPWVMRASSATAPFERENISLGDEDEVASISADTNLLFDRVIVTGQGVTLEWRADLGPPQRYALEGDPCLSEDTSWWFDGQRLLRNAGGDTVTIAKSEEMPWRRHACSDTQVLGVYYAFGPTADVRLCNQTSCPVSTKLPLAIDTQLVPLLGPSGPMLAAIAGDILVLWSPDSKGVGLEPRHAMRLATGTVVLGLIEWGDALGAVVRINDKTIGIAKIKR